MTDCYAIIGHPVDHSRSPDIHAAFAAQTGQSLTYTRLPAEPDGFVAAVRGFLGNGGHGLNVTLPFKQQAAALSDVVSDRARAAGAVNTLTRQANGSIAGDNTDGIGLLRDLRDNFGVDPSNQRLLVLGAGGAVRGIVAPLLSTEPAALVIANRTPAKARAIADLAGNNGAVTGCALADSAELEPFDIVINAISAGLNGEMPPLPTGLFATGAAAYDMVYADRPTPFLLWAKQSGVSRCRDGFGMLVEQAAESFCIWRGVRPQTAPVIAQLRPNAPD